jgi:hypothetical protein
MKAQISTNPIANLQPHYTDSFYSTARTVWLADGYKTNERHGTVKGVHYDYSDRVWRWDWHKADGLYKSIDASLDRRSPAFIQEFLRQYFDNPNLELVHVMAGFNVGNGYPYQVYGYLTGDEAQP